MDIKKLRQKKADALAKAKAITEAASAAGIDLTAEQRTQFDAHMQEATVAQGDIERAEALLNAERTAPGVSVQQSIAAGHNNQEDERFPTLAAQLSAIRTAAITHGRVVDPRLQASLGANETVDADGGFLVQPEFSSTLLTRIYEGSDVLSRCDQIPMGSSRLVLNGMVDDNRSTAAGRFGGFQVYRIGEGQPYVPSRPKFRRVELNANKLIAMFYATEELLADAPAIQNRAESILPQAFDYQLIDELFNGTGQGQMLGINTSGAVVVQPKDNGQTLSANPFTTTNILGMWSRLFVPSRKNACWFIQQDAEQYLMQLTLGSGSIAVELVYTPVGVNGNNGPYALLMGRPVIPVEQAAAVGTQGDIMLYDLSEYLVGNRQGLRADSSMHVAFNTGEMAFRWMLRNDGQPKWDKPLTARNSANTRSPFVTLATRT